MLSTRNKLYLFLAVACVAGYGCIFWTYRFYPLASRKEYGLCMFKKITSIPCPSCGSTRSILFLLQGDIAQAFMMNPIGIFLLIIMVVSPLWIAFDVIVKKNTLFHTYSTMENLLRKKSISLPMVALVLANWYWNITKGV